MIANLVNPKTKTLSKRKWVKMKKGDREVEGHILRNKDNVIEMGDVFKSLGVIFPAACCA